MKILVISRTPWNRNESFGNTFCNLFEGMQDVSIYSICCQSGSTNVSFLDTSFQMSDKSVLKSLLGKECGNIVAAAGEMRTDMSATGYKRPVRRNTFTLICRDMIWFLGRWKRSVSLKTYLEEIKPDVIYLPMYASWYMCDVQQYIINYYNVPVVGHISDDLYTYPETPCISKLAYFYRWVLRRKIRRLMSRIAYCDVFADNMAEIYSKEFKIPFYVIGKGVDLDSYCHLEYKHHKPIRFAYTGNLGDGRWRSLSMLAKTMDSVFCDGEAILDVYTQSVLTESELGELTSYKCVHFNGAVSADKVKKIQGQSDYLIHVESFSADAIFATRMSFSTKIVDYMLAGKPIIAIGPNSVNSISLLKTHNLGHVACSEPDLLQIVSQIANGKSHDKSILCNVEQYVVNNRNRSQIQRDMYNRLIQLIK